MTDKNAQRDAMIFRKRLAGDNDGKLVADERGSRLLNIVYGYPDLLRGIYYLSVNLSSLCPSYIAITIARVNRNKNRLRSKHAVV